VRREDANTSVLSSAILVESANLMAPASARQVGLARIAANQSAPQVAQDMATARFQGCASACPTGLDLTARSSHAPRNVLVTANATTQKQFAIASQDIPDLTAPSLIARRNVWLQVVPVECQISAAAQRELHPQLTSQTGSQASSVIPPSFRFAPRTATTTVIASVMVCALAILGGRARTAACLFAPMTALMLVPACSLDVVNVKLWPMVLTAATSAAQVIVQHEVHASAMAHANVMKDSTATTVRKLFAPTIAPARTECACNPPEFAIAQPTSLERIVRTAPPDTRASAAMNQLAHMTAPDMDCAKHHFCAIATRDTQAFSVRRATVQATVPTMEIASMAFAVVGRATRDHRARFPFAMEEPRLSSQAKSALDMAAVWALTGASATRVGSEMIAQSPTVTISAITTANASLKAFACALRVGRDLLAHIVCALMIARAMESAWHSTRHTRLTSIPRSISERNARTMFILSRRRSRAMLPMCSHMIL